MCFTAVEFPDDPNVVGIKYWYACTYEDVKVGDGVIAPLGRHNNLQKGIVREVRFEYEYFVFRHAAAFVQRGARVLRLGDRMSGNAFAFQNADGSIVLAVQNPFAYEKAISFCGEVVSLAPQSITSLVFKT